MNEEKATPEINPDRPGNWYRIDGKLVDVPIGKEDEIVYGKTKPKDGPTPPPIAAPRQD